MTTLIPLILSGGSGTRLWPASRQERPKQFLPLLGERSTFQSTLQRVAPEDGDAVRFGRPVVVTGEAHRFLVAQQLAEIAVEADILVEPSARDSGPALLAGAHLIAERDGDAAALIALAADHAVRDIDAFRSDAGLAGQGAESGHIVTFGILPTDASPAYGYVRVGEPFPGIGEGRISMVDAFIEKPTAAVAADYLERGYLWNSGNFVSRADTIISEYAAFDRQTTDAVARALSHAERDADFVRLDRTSFDQAAKTPFDKAVMEKTTRAALVVASFDWCDVGTWGALHGILPKDRDGNAVIADGSTGALLALRAGDSTAYTDGPHIVLQDVEGLCVVATKDIVLVAPRASLSPAELLDLVAAAKT